MAFGLFQRFGVELEYMVVDRDTLAARPVVDVLLKSAASHPGAQIAEGEDETWPGSIEWPDVAWSNELTLHVLEFKTAAPATTLAGLAEAFASHVRTANELLAPMNAMLMPGGMHPTMLPDREMVLWPHGYNDVYGAFNRIFDCRGHGWANLQSCHLNLPFNGDDAPDGEFGRLHAAIRALLPIMPALSASSPMKEGARTGMMDTRLEVYRTNSARIPQTAGKVIPEPVFTRTDYQQKILQPIYDAYAPFDPEGVLRDEWANARGAIARFSRGTIEVRVLDVQECPAADLAIVSAISSALESMTRGELGDLGAAREMSVDRLHAVLLGVIRDADDALITDADFLRMLGVRASQARARDVWRDILERTMKPTRAWALHAPALRVILDKGCLARRMVGALGISPGPSAIASLSRELAGCLNDNRQLSA